MSYEVTRGTDTDPVVLTLSGLPVYVDEDDSSRVTFLLSPDDAESIGEALAHTPSGTVRTLRDELEEARKDAAYYKEWADGNGRRLTANQHALAVVAGDVDELKATIVRQANEITALKGESA